MTAADLRSILATSLSGLLGTYTDKDGSTYPAIYVGNPPSSWTATGLECRIGIVPDMDQTPAYVTGAITETHRVRLVSHGAPINTLPALRKVLSRWSTAQAREIPPNEELGILAQHTITIPT